MALVDELKIHAKAGKGGDGVVRWRHEKFIAKGGPAGGDGGRGGDFYVLAVRDIHTLSRYSGKKEFEAGDGKDGGKKSAHGRDGEDFVLELPVGSLVRDVTYDRSWSLDEEGQKILILKGGYGGFGNEHFKGSTNTTPKEANPGGEGEEADLEIELELFADLGLVGMPNAGKSSMLNSLTGARAKIGDYPFTTLDPNLGNFFGFILADIPGLIEGASEGKGLGTKFLRHIRRTKMLAHLVSFENEDMMKTYKDIRAELEKYDKQNRITEGGLADKEEIVVLTKTDILEDPKTAEEKKKEFEALGKPVFTLSLYDDESVKNFSDHLAQILEK